MVQESELTKEKIISIQSWLDEVVPDKFKLSGLNLAKYPIQNGYNFYNSYRAGFKTTSDLLFIVRAFCQFGTTALYCRTSSRTTVKSKIFTLCDVLNSYVNDAGKNYIQQASNDKYCWISYHATSKTFRLLENLDQDPKTAPICIYVVPVSESLSFKSGFADINANIILWDEFIDEYVNNDSTILFLNLVSTAFRLRYNSVIFMNCNMSIGSPVVLRKFGIYEKVLEQTDEFFVYHTKKGMQISVTVLEPFEETQNNDRAKMNMTYFAFDTHIEGIENIIGSSITHEPYRELPENSTLTDTGIYFYTCGYFIKSMYCMNEKYQPMYYFKRVLEPEHDAGHIILTDDKLYALSTPWAYYSILRDNAQTVDIAKSVRRSDVCYENFTCYISMKSFYDFFKIPDNI